MLLSDCCLAGSRANLDGLTLEQGHTIAFWPVNNGHLPGCSRRFVFMRAHNSFLSFDPPTASWNALEAQIATLSAPRDHRLRPEEDRRHTRQEEEQQEEQHRTSWF